MVSEKVDSIKTEKELIEQYKEYEKKFENVECSKCKGTPLQKERECDALFGFKHLACEFMTETITTKMQPENREFIKNLISKQEGNLI